MTNKFDNLPFYKPAEDMAEIFKTKTGTDAPQFFRLVVAYYMGIVASAMRTNISTLDRGIIPVNNYSILLGTSGLGKGYSTSTFENDILKGFRRQFLGNTFPEISKMNLENLSKERALSKGTNEDEEYLEIQKSFEDSGEYALYFDSGTSPAVKQMRSKLMMSKIGSLNLTMDELANNFTSNAELLDVFIQLFDIGLIKQKLIKNTKENTRAQDTHSATPANMLLFGSPSKLLSGSALEKEFFDWLETGFGRRCFFAYIPSYDKDEALSAEEIFNKLSDSSTEDSILALSEKFEELALVDNYNDTIEFTKESSIYLIEYQNYCIERANALPAHSALEKTELIHRYFKVLKQVGAYAFFEKTPISTQEQLEGAIALAEESGKHFYKLINRDRPHIRLAKYLADVTRPVTQADILNDLTFYKGTESARKELLNLAIAWGYNNNVSISKTMVEDVLLLEGKSLQETDIDNIILSYSPKITEDYKSETVPFNRLKELVVVNGLNFINHHVKDGYRDDKHIIDGFNMVILDVDKNVKIDTAKILLDDYEYIMYTTKRHTEKEHRFRIILPLSHTLEMKTEEYKDFMRNLYKWLPFEVDEQTFDRPRKWLTNSGEYFENRGKLLDSTLFIPNTNKATKMNKISLDTEGLNNVERWFVTNTVDGNRSSQFIRYAYMLVDSGLSFEDIKDKIFALNMKIKNPLAEAELLTTVLSSTLKAIEERN